MSFREINKKAKRSSKRDICGINWADYFTRGQPKSPSLSRAKLFVVVWRMRRDDWRAVGGVNGVVQSFVVSRQHSTVVIRRVKCSDRVTCQHHRDGVLPVSAAVLAALHVQPDLIHVVVGRWTRFEGTRAGSLRAVLDSRARKTLCRRGVYSLTHSFTFIATARVCPALWFARAVALGFVLLC